MREEFTSNYVVIKDGTDVYAAEAGFNSKAAAIEYADKRASEHEAFNPSDSDSVYNSARVAHYEVVDAFSCEQREHAVNSDDAWETVTRQGIFITISD